MKIKINTTGDTFWNRAAAALNGEEGEVLEIGSGAYQETTISPNPTDGEPDIVTPVGDPQHVTIYDANFPIYGARFIGIPSSVCTITE